jgi:hypothetical protein
VYPSIFFIAWLKMMMMLLLMVTIRMKTNRMEKNVDQEVEEESL